MRGPLPEQSMGTTTAHRGRREVLQVEQVVVKVWSQRKQGTMLKFRVLRSHRRAREWGRNVQTSRRKVSEETMMGGANQPDLRAEPSRNFEHIQFGKEENEYGES